MKGSCVKMKTDYDLIVVGGGLTGTAAAIGAAREGLSVLLVEKGGFLGGAISNCYINPFMQYRIFPDDGSKLVINRGVFLELLQRLDEMGGILDNRNTFNEEYLKMILDKMTTEAGVDVLFHAYFTEVTRIGSEIKSITVDTRMGSKTFTAKYFIDASGDANLSFKAGCPYKVGREGDNLCQPMTLCFRMANVDFETLNENRNTLQETYKKFQQEGKIKNPREDVLLFKHTSDGVLHLNSTRIVGLSPLDPVDLSKAEKLVREQVMELYTFMKENCPGCENATLLSSAPEIGVRESRMIVGDYTLTVDDLTECKKFDDAIAVGAYGVDIHSPDGSGTVRVFIKKGDYYTIPYRSLLPEGVDNLLTAGRCISSTHEAQSAYRVLPIVCNIGEAAGLAAAQACKNGTDTRSIDIKELHSTMEKYDLLYK